MGTVHPCPKENSRRRTGPRTRHGRGRHSTGTAKPKPAALPLYIHFRRAEDDDLRPQGRTPTVGACPGGAAHRARTLQRAHRPFSVREATTAGPRSVPAGWSESADERPERDARLSHAASGLFFVHYPTDALPRSRPVPPSESVVQGRFRFPQGRIRTVPAPRRPESTTQGRSNQFRNSLSGSEWPKFRHEKGMRFPAVAMEPIRQEVPEQLKTKRIRSESARMRTLDRHGKHGRKFPTPSGPPSGAEPPFNPRPEERTSPPQPPQPMASKGCLTMTSESSAPTSALDTGDSIHSLLNEHPRS